MSLDGFPPVSRRQLLLGAGAAGVVAVAGCARDEAGESAQPAGSPTSDAAAGSSTAELFPQPEVRQASQGALATTLTCASGTVDAGGRTIDGHTYEGATPGPTLKLSPGDNLRIGLVNNLDSSAGGNGMGGGGNGGGMQMGSGAATNLHTHGLHVSPEGNQDNVFLMVDQGQTQDYDIAIPESHWGGLNWYHPHHHGNVSVQVLGGMQGALIISGPLDEVPEVAAVTEQVLVLQRLQEGPAMIARMSAMHDNAFLSANGNPTFAVNGQVNPRITLRPSQVQRWRLLNADAIDYFDIALVDADGEDVPGALHILAFDGITLPSVRTVTRRRMVPGNRLEVLVQMPDVPGEVQLVGRAVPGFGQPDIVFATVDVAGEPVDSAIPETLPAQLTPIAAEEVQTERRVQFGSFTNAMTINGVSFDQGPDEMEMVVGSVEEWTIENLSDQDHAFHIHTNPFWVVAEGGVELSEPAYFDTYAIPPATGPDSPGSLTVRFRPTQFTGRIVQHCHILPHEDAGMMGVVSLV
ncbi:MAG: multicopper oxidase domain-containing protein [Actinobacteria bacterium]|nr:multicopper oxidase domain-containing protein [Actinomycetota bacterium]